MYLIQLEDVTGRECRTNKLDSLKKDRLPYKITVEQSKSVLVNLQSVIDLIKSHKRKPHGHTFYDRIYIPEYLDFEFKMASGGMYQSSCPPTHTIDPDHVMKRFLKFAST